MVGRFWRVARTPLILLALVVLLLVAGKWGYDKVVEPLPPPAAEPCTQQPVQNGQLHSEQVSVQVFNASNKRGKGAEVAQQLKKQGFKITKVGNADKAMPKSEVRGADAKSPEVTLVAQQFKDFATAGDKRADRMVVVYIGADYDSMIDNAPTSIKVDSTSICLPVPPTANPV